MSRVRAFFLQEAARCLSELSVPAAPRPRELRRLHAAARRLRGSAQLARYPAVVDVALPLERRLKTLAGGDEPWSAGTAAAVADQVRAVERAVQAVRDGTIQQQSGGTMAEEQSREAGVPEVAIRELEYAGEAALRRALELRRSLEEALDAGEPAAGILDELFDLIRLGME